MENLTLFPLYQTTCFFISFVAPCKPLLNTDNILHADTSAEFIRKYFENGEKELPLLLNPEYAAAFLKDYFLAARKERVLFFEFDRQYALPPERAIHTVSGFFLGLLIESCLNAENSLSIEGPGYFPFSYFWFLTFLYHDYGYCVVERDDCYTDKSAHS